MAKIVVLDDRPDICETIKLRLLDDGHDVRTTQTGDEAIDFGYLFQPDVLIADWRLKCEYDGIEVARAVRAANKNTITILITGCSIEDVKSQAATADIFQTLAKPFSLELLVGVIQNALNQRAVSDRPASLTDTV